MQWGCQPGAAQAKPARIAVTGFISAYYRRTLPIELAPSATERSIRLAVMTIIVITPSQLVSNGDPPEDANSLERNRGAYGALAPGHASQSEPGPYLAKERFADLHFSEGLNQLIPNQQF